MFRRDCIFVEIIAVECWYGTWHNDHIHWMILAHFFNVLWSAYIELQSHIFACKQSLCRSFKEHLKVWDCNCWKLCSVSRSSVCRLWLASICTEFNEYYNVTVAVTVLIFWWSSVKDNEIAVNMKVDSLSYVYIESTITSLQSASGYPARRLAL